MYLKGAHILTCPPSSYLTLAQILKPHSMGGNNTECLAELEDYLHQEYLAKKGANSLFSIFGQKIDVRSMFNPTNTSRQESGCGGV